MASKLTLIRRLAVQQARAQLYEVPGDQLVEVPGAGKVLDVHVNGLDPRKGNNGLWCGIWLW